MSPLMYRSVFNDEVFGYVHIRYVETSWYSTSVTTLSAALWAINLSATQVSKMSWTSQTNFPRVRNSLPPVGLRLHSDITHICSEDQKFSSENWTMVRKQHCHYRYDKTGSCGVRPYIIIQTAVSNFLVILAFCVWWAVLPALKQLLTPNIFLFILYIIIILSLNSIIKKMSLFLSTWSL